MPKLWPEIPRTEQATFMRLKLNHNYIVEYLERIQRGLIVLRDQNRMMERYLAGEFDDLEYPGETMSLMSDFAEIFAREWEQLPASMQDVPIRNEMDERKWEMLNENYR